MIDKKSNVNLLESLNDVVTMSSAKVYVTNTPNGHEWSFDAPAQILDKTNSLLNGSYSAKNCLTLFSVMPEIFAPINEIATRVSSLKFVLKRFSDDQIVWDNDQFNRLFTKPNPLMDFKKHIWSAVVYKYLTGGSFQFVNKPKLRTAGFESIKTIVNIPTDKILFDVDKNNDPYTATDIKDFIKRIYIKRHNNTDRDFEIENVLMIVNPDVSDCNSLNKFTSALSGASAAIANLIPVYLARKAIYINRGALGFIVSGKTDVNGSIALTKIEKQDAQREFQRMYGVTGQDAIFPILSSAVDFVKTSASIQEMQPFDETEQDARSIYAVLRVPKHLCPTRGNSTFANADADLKTFYTDVIIPEGELFCQSYTNGLAIDGHYIDIDTSSIEILQGNKKEKAETSRTSGDVMEKRFKNGICTLNEWVIETGGEPSPNPLYDKKLFEMDENELEIIKKYINLQTQQQTTPQNESIAR